MQQKKLRQKHLQAQQEAREQEEKTRKTKVQMNTSEQFEEQRRQAAMERALVRNLQLGACKSHSDTCIAWCTACCLVLLHHQCSPQSP